MHCHCDLHFVAPFIHFIVDQNIEITESCPSTRQIACVIKVTSLVHAWEQSYSILATSSLPDQHPRKSSCGGATRLEDDQFGKQSPDTKEALDDISEVMGACCRIFTLDFPRLSSSRVVNRIFLGVVCHLSLHWAPGHNQVPRNEIADALAKAVIAEDPSTDSASLALARCMIKHMS